MSNTQAIPDIAPAVKYRPKPKRYYFDVALSSILLSGEDTGGACCLPNLSVAPGLGVAGHMHTREDEAYFVVSGAGFEEFLIATSVPAPDDAVAPTEPAAVAVRNVFQLAADYGIRFGD